LNSREKGKTLGKVSIEDSLEGKETVVDVVELGKVWDVLHLGPGRRHGRNRGTKTRYHLCHNPVEPTITVISTARVGTVAHTNCDVLCWQQVL
jgi:hypothetical protein